MTSYDGDGAEAGDDGRVGSSTAMATTRNVAICDDLLVMPLTFVIEWYVICDEISIFVIGAN
jgi:hypothetical protein